MIAAIYARKSTEQHGADADAKSVARQIENARAFAARERLDRRRRARLRRRRHQRRRDAELVNRQRLLDALATGATALSTCSSCAMPRASAVAMATRRSAS